TCGDQRCNGNETCLTCPGDCGACLACSAAPSCTDALGVPASPTRRYDLDVNATDTPDLAGTPPAQPAGNDCTDPQIRVRIAKINVAKGGGKLYCIVSASDGARSEVAITTKTRDLGDNEANYFDPTVAMFWGQKTLATTTDNLTITYDCFKVGSDAWAKALQALSDASQH